MTNIFMVMVVLLLLTLMMGLSNGQLVLPTDKTNSVTIVSPSSPNPLIRWVSINYASSSSFWMNFKIDLVSSNPADVPFMINVTEPTNNSFPKKTIQVSSSKGSSFSMWQQVAPSSTTRFVQIEIAYPSVATLNAKFEVYTKFSAHPLSEGDIVGIAIGSTVAGVIALFYGVFYLHKLKQKKKPITVNLLLDVFFESLRDLFELSIKFINKFKTKLIQKIKDGGKFATRRLASSSARSSSSNNHNALQQPVQEYTNNNYNNHATFTAIENSNMESPNTKEVENGVEFVLEYHYPYHDEVEQVVDPIDLSQVRVEETKLGNLSKVQKEWNEEQKERSRAPPPAYQESEQQPSIFIPQPSSAACPTTTPSEVQVVVAHHTTSTTNTMIVLPQPSPTPIEDNHLSNTTTIPRGVPRVVVVPQVISPPPQTLIDTFPPPPVYTSYSNDPQPIARPEPTEDDDHIIIPLPSNII